MSTITYYEVGEYLVKYNNKIKGSGYYAERPTKRWQLWYKPTNTKVEEFTSSQKAIEKAHSLP